MEKPGMVQSWWQAHELELVLSVVVLGISAVIWIIYMIWIAVEERAQKKKDGLL